MIPKSAIRITESSRAQPGKISRKTGFVRCAASEKTNFPLKSDQKEGQAASGLPEFKAGHVTSPL
jgi:hypothetical protein